MCGVAGIVTAFGAMSNELHSCVELMCKSLHDRGPDYSATWSNHSVSLGHTRLAIMAPGDANANQPMQAGNWVLTFNGEIYNFTELRSELEDKGYRFRTDGDTEVLARLLEEDGIDKSLEKISGIFAFCAYDTENEIAYLVRDRLGVKPLYYWQDQSNNTLWFSSTPAAIVNAGTNSWSLNRDSVFSFFHLGAPLATETFFDGIVRVRPAEMIEINISSHDISFSYYWNPEFRDGRVEDYIEQAILREKESHVESAVFLSGGIDSSLMTLILSDVKAFHLSSSELLYAEYIASKAGVELEVKEYLSEINISKLLIKYARSSGEASASSPIPLLVSELLSSEGYKVAFSANGADELFLGYPRTPTPELLPENMTSQGYETASVSTNGQRCHIFRNENAINIPGVNSAHYTQDLHDLYGLRTLDKDFPPSAHHRWLELQTYVAHDLNPTLDFSSMSFAVEVRVPFLDHQLVEKCLSVDANEFIKSDYGRKYPLKKMLKKRGVSPALWSRSKVGFSMPEKLIRERRQQIRDSLVFLDKMNLFTMDETSNYTIRDEQYLHSAAHAFSAWSKVWIKSGKVSI